VLFSHSSPDWMTLSPQDRIGERGGSSGLEGFVCGCWFVAGRVSV